MLIVDSEGAQFAPATLQVQACNHQTDFQRAASHFNDGRLLNYSIVGFQRVGVVHAWVGQKLLNCFIFKIFFSIGHR